MLIRRCNREGFGKRFAKVKNNKVKMLREVDVSENILSFIGFGLYDDDPECPVFFMVDKNGEEYMATMSQDHVKELCREILNIYEERESEEDEE